MNLSAQFRGFDARRGLRGVDSVAFHRALIDGDEDGRLPLANRHRSRNVRAPHGVGLFGDDRSFVAAWTKGPFRPVRRKKAVESHHPQDSRPRCTDIRRSQASPHLAVAFTDERRGEKDLPDSLGELLVSQLRLRASFEENPFGCFPSSLAGVEGRTGQLELLAPSPHAVDAIRGAVRFASSGRR